VGQFVLTKFIRAAMLGERPVINGDGSQVRSYCYVEDACRGTIAATLRRRADGEVFNIGNSMQPWTLLEVARLVIRLAGKQGQIEPILDSNFERGDRLRSREIFNRFCDTTKAREWLGFQPTIPLEEGVQRIISVGVPPQSWRAIRVRH
jgi:nucleoside-diphosphate-sugar epimerase